MARVIGNPFGELRGKLAGNVFSRNASGAIVRQYVIPANANSIAQNVSRNLFRASSQAYKSITEILKAGWSVFATGSFTPQTKINIGQYTGAQSFVSLRTAVSNANSKTFAGTFVGTTMTTLAEVPSVFTPLDIAPVSSVVPDLAQPVGPPATVELLSASLTAAGIVEIVLGFMGLPPLANLADNFVDSSQNKYSLVAYASDVVSGAGNRPKNDLFQSLGNTAINTFITNTLAGEDGVTITWDFSSLITGFKNWGSVGNTVKLTVFAVGENGTLARVGEQFVVLA